MTTILTYEVWNTFTLDCINSRPCNNDLFLISMEFMSEDLGSVKKNATALFNALEDSYELKNITVADVESFLSRVCLLTKAKAYGSIIPDRSGEIPSWIRLDAQNRSLADVYRTPTTARADLYGETYLNEFTPNVPY